MKRSNILKKLIIDRFEGEYAVCETQSLEFVNIPKKALPENAKEGDVLTVAIDGGETESRKKKIDGLMNSLFSD